MDANYLNTSVHFPSSPSLSSHSFIWNFVSLTPSNPLFLFLTLLTLTLSLSHSLTLSLSHSLIPLPPHTPSPPLLTPSLPNSHSFSSPPLPPHFLISIPLQSLTPCSHPLTPSSSSPSPLSSPARDPQVDTSTYHPQWNYSAAILQFLEGGIDNGSLPSTACRITKTSPDSSLRVAFNGNLRLTGCSNCCMRWFVTIDGSECVDPAPIDGVLYNSASYVNIHRGATITGICNQTENETITGTGTYEAVLNVGMCEGFNESYNAFTGFQGVSTMYIEEMPRREWRGREG